MNLVGKIFVVVIFVMCLVFMSLTMAVYTAQRNWYEVVMLEPQKVTPGKTLGLKYQLAKAKSDNQELKDLKEKLQKEYDAEKLAKQKALSMLQTELDVLKAERKTLVETRASLEKEKSNAVAAMNATQKNSTTYQQELDSQRTKLEQARKDRDEHFKHVVELTDQLNQAVNEKETLRNRMVELAKDSKKAEDALRYYNINKDSDYANTTPPKVSGIVLQVLDGGLIEISIGSDQGLRKGHMLQIARTNGEQVTYVGRVEVMKTDPSKAVCKFDPKYQTSNVMVNDRVASKFD